jgi:hypothetical protein
LVSPSPPRERALTTLRVPPLRWRRRLRSALWRRAAGQLFSLRNRDLPGATSGCQVDRTYPVHLSNTRGTGPVRQVLSLPVTSRGGRTQAKSLCHPLWETHAIEHPWAKPTRSMKNGPRPGFASWVPWLRCLQPRVSDRQRVVANRCNHGTRRTPIVHCGRRRVIPCKGGAGEIDVTPSGEVTAHPGSAKGQKSAVPLYILPVFAFSRTAEKSGYGRPRTYDFGAAIRKSRKMRHAITISLPTHSRPGSKKNLRDCMDFSIGDRIQNRKVLGSRSQDSEKSERQQREKWPQKSRTYVHPAAQPASFANVGIRWPSDGTGSFFRALCGKGCRSRSAA